MALIAPTSHVLRIHGQMPSKKNCYEVSRIYGRDGKAHWGLRIRDDAKALIDTLGYETNSAWARLGLAKPLIHPRMTIEFAVSTDRIDRDGLCTTALDLLQQARAIRNDNVRYFNGEVRILPALMCQPGNEKATIWLEES